MATNKNKKTTKTKLPKFWALIGVTYKELVTFWRPLLGVTLVYGLLYFVLVLGFAISYSYNDIANNIALQLGTNSSWLAKNSLIVIDLFAYSNQTDTAAIVQFLLFIVATTAIIWALRRLRSLKHIRLRDAYYEGPARIVPFLLVVVSLIVTLLPAAIGSSLFAVAQAAGAQGIELVVVGLLSGLLLFGSFYWLSAWLPAAYIVLLPKGTPITAIKSSVQLTKKHRMWILKNIAAFTLLAIFIGFSSMLLIVSLVSIASVVAAYVVSFILFCIAQTFLFTMYRSLVDEA